MTENLLDVVADSLKSSTEYVSTVLLIPADPLLLMDGPHGSRPPTMKWGQRPLIESLSESTYLCKGCNTWCDYGGHPHTGGTGSYDCKSKTCGGGARVELTCFRYGPQPTGLVLASEGRAVPEGIYRLWLWNCGSITGPMPYQPTLFQAVQWARLGKSYGYGTDIFLNSEGKQIDPNSRDSAFT